MVAATAPAPIPAPLIEVPAPAPVAPHRRLAEDLKELGFAPAVAGVLSRSIVNPSEAKRRLATPDVQRTATADIHTIATRLWSPLLLAHPDNKRQTAHRPLPMSGAAMRFPPLPLVTSDACEPWLSLDAVSADHLIYALQQAEEWFIHDNPLWEQIGEEGVLRPHTAVAVDVSLTDEGEHIVIIGSADGSSRTSSAHRNLNLSVRDIVTFVRDDRAFRRYIGDLRKRAEAGDLSESDMRAIRSLTVPADVVVRVVPRSGVATTTARAVRSLVGLMHVQPPKVWKDESRFDAVGEEILEELVNEGLTSELERAYLAGQITLAEAAHNGLPRHSDERAGMVLQTFRKFPAEVKRAFKRVTHTSRVHKRPTTNVAAEMAMRSYRDPAPHADMQTSRVGLQLAWMLKEVWESEWALTLRSPEEIRDAALAELGSEGGLGPNQIELAVLGSFELTRAQVLAQYSLTKTNRDTNLSSPAAILRLMASTPLGIHMLYQAVAEGRRGAAKFLRVRDDGTIWYSGSGETENIDSKWLRKTFRPDEEPTASPQPAETPETDFRARQAQIAGTVHSLRAQVTELAVIKDDNGDELVRTLGWRPDGAVPLVRELNSITRSIHQWVAAYRIANGLTLGPADDAPMSEASDDEDTWE